VPRYGHWIPATLEYKYCARGCGAHVSFVALTNAVCRAQFQKIIQHAISSWMCPGYLKSYRSSLVSCGDNSDKPQDAAVSIIEALWKEKTVDNSEELSDMPPSVRPCLVTEKDAFSPLPRACCVLCFRDFFFAPSNRRNKSMQNNDQEKRG
jgi:hypothetical protein